MYNYTLPQNQLECLLHSKQKRALTSKNHKTHDCSTRLLNLKRKNDLTLLILTQSEICIQVNKSKKWNAITYPITNLPQNNETPPLPDYETYKPLKFLPQYCYYTDGSFFPSQQIDDSWTREKQDMVYIINPKT